MAGSWQNISLYLAKAKPWVPEATRCSLDIPKQYFFFREQPSETKSPPTLWRGGGRVPLGNGSRNDPSINHFCVSPFSPTPALCCYPCPWSVSLVHPVGMSATRPAPLGTEPPHSRLSLNMIPSASHLPEIRHSFWSTDISSSPSLKFSHSLCSSLLAFWEKVKHLVLEARTHS